jgi:hypothetical protein
LLDAGHKVLSRSLVRHIYAGARPHLLSEQLPLAIALSVAKIGLGWNGYATLNDEWGIHGCYLLGLETSFYFVGQLANQCCNDNVLHVRFLGTDSNNVLLGFFHITEHTEASTTLVVSDELPAHYLD